MRSLLLAAVLAIVAAPAAQAARRHRSRPSTAPRSCSPSIPRRAAAKAPTILEGHGWGGSRETDPDAKSDEATGNVGVGALRKAGFNVLTWDSRGFGNSGGTVTVDSPDAEGRDVSALIDWLAKQPEAQLDKAGDPRVGMTGVSYAGGIELVDRGARQAHRRDRPDHRLALAADVALQGGDGQGRLGDAR